MQSLQKLADKARRRELAAAFGGTPMNREAYAPMAVKRLACVIVMSLLAGSVFAKGKSGIQSTYDKFKDFTEVSTKTLFVHRGFVGSLRLSFSYICQGNTDSCHPDTVFADFRGASATGLYTEFHSVTFLADGTRIVPVEKETWNSTVSADSVRTSVYETILARLSVADFLKIANASDVEGEVGPTRFSVKGKQLELWRELAEKIGH
jgi:hypothetical protein